MLLRDRITDPTGLLSEGVGMADLRTGTKAALGRRAAGRACEEERRGG